MEQTQKTAKDDLIFKGGVIANILSFLFYLFIKEQKGRIAFDVLDDEPMFIVNFIFAAGYYIILMVNQLSSRGWKFSLMDKRQYLNAVVLFGISAFALNLSIPVFENFSLWSEIYFFLMFLPLIALSIIPKPTKYVRALLLFVMGAGTVMATYFTVYLLPFAPIGIIGCFVFGLSLHLFAPVILLMTYIYNFIKLKEGPLDSIGFATGIAIPLIMVMIFMVKWNTTHNEIGKANAQMNSRSENTLPSWVILSQNLDDDFFTERIIEGNLLYTVPRRGFWGEDIWMPNMGSSFSEVKEHDPLVYLGYWLSGKVGISRKDRIKILESKFDARHLAQRKLWSGKDLTTGEVVNNVQIFPEYRLAYAEKTLTIHNNDRRGWRSQQEALYTFHLPEGSVVTSLSLWIEGKEEKSRLTTKQKADSAYVSIVGVERRDPALLHWQEGNTVTVTVFPCTPKEDRMFKIGVTTPMELRGDRLVLGNVYFEGPESFWAQETTVIEVVSDAEVEGLRIPSLFTDQGTGKYEYTGNHTNYWEMSCKAMPPSKETFSFNQKQYQIQELKSSLQPLEVDEFYLDLNESWSKSEFNAVMEMAAGKKVFVFEDNPILVNEKNKDEIFDHFGEHNFSLFPMNAIQDPARSLLISKSEELSPSLDDLEGTQFNQNMETYLRASNGRINLFTLNHLSPYLQTLKEFQIFNYAQGEVEELASLIKTGQFPMEPSGENIVNLSDAGISITLDSSEVSTGAPNHLMRLFAYSKIMQTMGKNYFSADGYVTEELVGIASEAYVVSPVSSLIVLETVKDYDRFGIDENRNSLGNASTKNAGAVPEPHEWALLILLMSILSYLTWKRWKAKNLAA